VFSKCGETQSWLVPTRIVSQHGMPVRQRQGILDPGKVAQDCATFSPDGNCGGTTVQRDSMARFTAAGFEIVMASKFGNGYPITGPALPQEATSRPKTPA
jgi:hypothetical protein